jgi:hypothetical protein
MSHLAFYTFGLLRQPFDSAPSQEFLAAAPAVFDAVTTAPGLIARRPAPAGGVPRVPDGGEEHPVAHTLTLWTDLESVYAFSYRSVHATALRRRKDWFLPAGWPSYAAWWVAGHALPTWQEAFARFEHLHDHGPTPFVFDFKHPFDAAGQLITIDRARVSALVPSLR